MDFGSSEKSQRSIFGWKSWSSILLHNREGLEGNIEQLLRKENSVGQGIVTRAIALLGEHQIFIRKVLGSIPLHVSEQFSAFPSLPSSLLHVKLSAHKKYNKSFRKYVNHKWRSESMLR